MEDNKTRSGYRVIGYNTTDCKLHEWYFGSLEMADKFAQQLCIDTRKEVDVCKYIGSYRIAAPPVEYIKSED